MKKLMLTTLALCLATAALAQGDAAKAPEAAKPVEKGAAAAAAKKMAAAKAPEASDVAIKAIDAQIAAAKVNKKNAGWRNALPKPTPVKFDSAKQYLLRMVTNKGTVVIQFMPEVAPMHVTNFIYLTRMGFYDGLTFHRVITKFMAQGGDPVGNGMGGPGYGFGGEFNANVKHDKPGRLSMANAGPGTDGSQFFLTFVATPWLDGKHTIFGEVVEGLDVLKALEAAGSQGGQTSEKLTMDRVTVEVK